MPIGKTLTNCKEYLLRSSQSSDGASTTETTASLRKVKDWLDTHTQIAETSVQGEKRKRVPDFMDTSPTSSVDQLTIEEIENLLSDSPPQDADVAAEAGLEVSPTQLAQTAGSNRTYSFDSGDTPRAEIAFQEVLPGILFDHVSLMLKTFMTGHITTFGTKASAFIHAPQRRYAHIGYKMLALDFFWEEYGQDDCVVRWDECLYALKDMTFEEIDPRASKSEDKENYTKNVIGVLYGDMLTIPGEELQDRYVRDQPRFFFQSSVSVNDCSQGLYLDVSRTEYAGLHKQIGMGPSNCEVISVFDNRLQTEILLLRLTANCKQGDPLILKSLHRHDFILQKRAPSKKLKWFSSFNL